jgi:hypothetical protein
MADDRLSCGGWMIAASGADSLLPDPVLTLDQIRIGPHPREEDFARKEIETAGSSFVWGDLWAFDRTTRALRSLIWHIPEDNMRARPRLPAAARPARLAIATADREPDAPRLRHFTPGRLVCGGRRPCSSRAATSSRRISRSSWTVGAGGAGSWNSRPAPCGRAGASSFRAADGGMARGRLRGHDRQPPRQ